MTKSQIRAELRRSACEDEDPYQWLGPDAFNEIDRISNWRSPGQFLEFASEDTLRTFFLLVAEAME